MTPVVQGHLRGANVWMLPMRKPIVDNAGRLRMGYWEGNDALRGPSVPLLPALAGPFICTSGATNVTWLTEFSAAQHDMGGFLTLDLDGLTGIGSIGIAIEDSCKF